MSSIYVQFSDSGEIVITALFSSPQDTADYPYQGVVEDSDPRYVVYWNTLADDIKSWWPTPTTA